MKRRNQRVLLRCHIKESTTAENGLFGIARAQEKSGGGIYLFEEEVSVKAYLDREIVAGILSHPAISDTGAKVFDVIPERSKIT